MLSTLFAFGISAWPSIRVALRPLGLVLVASSLRLLTLLVAATIVRHAARAGLPGAATDGQGEAWLLTPDDDTGITTEALVPHESGEPS